MLMTEYIKLIKKKLYYHSIFTICHLKLLFIVCGWPTKTWLFLKSEVWNWKYILVLDSSFLFFSRVDTIEKKHNMAKDFSSSLGITRRPISKKPIYSGLELISDSVVDTNQVTYYISVNHCQICSLPQSGGGYAYILLLE